MERVEKSPGASPEQPRTPMHEQATRGCVYPYSHPEGCRASAARVLAAHKSGDDVIPGVTSLLTERPY